MIMTRHMMAACAGIGRGHRVRPIPGHFGGIDASGARAAYDAFLARAAAEPGAVRTKSGLVYRELEAGRGAAPGATDSVTVRYRVTDPNGTVVEDSAEYGGAVTVRLSNVEPCVREAVRRMRSGGRSRFLCPPPPPGREEATEQRVPVAVEATLLAVGQTPLPHGH
jgi:FKBP-type peptidyl-prolyl cis-trans isomerase